MHTTCIVIPAPIMRISRAATNFVYQLRPTVSLNKSVTGYGNLDSQKPSPGNEASIFQGAIKLGRQFRSKTPNIAFAFLES